MRTLPDGTRYRVTHTRVLKPIAATFYVSPRQMRDAFEQGAPLGVPALVDARGGVTLVEILAEDGETVIARAEAFCSAKDNYNRKLGRDIALGRALKAARETGQPQAVS